MLSYALSNDASFTHRQLCLQCLLQFYSHPSKHCNNNRSEKTIDDTKSSKNIPAESGCIWSWGWFTGSTFVHYSSCHDDKRKHSNSIFWDHFELFLCHSVFSYLCLSLWCGGSNSGQILGCSFLSPIPGTRDSKASCCCGYLELDLVSAIPMLMSIWIPNAVGIISVPVESVCYITTAFFYFKIYLAVRHHSNQIHVLQAQLAQNNEGDMTNAARERKTAVGTFYVYLVFLICYLPSTCYGIIHRSAGPSTMLFQFGLHANTLIFLNSTLNPLIYSWKMRHVRHAVMEILRNILPNLHQWGNKDIVEKLGNRPRIINYADLDETFILRLLIKMP